MKDILAELAAALGMDHLPRRAFELEQMPPVIDSRFRVDEAATAVSVAEGLLISHLWEMRTGRAQTVRVNTAHAALTTLSFLLQTQNECPVSYPDTHRTWPHYPTMAPYKSRDGRFVYLAGVYPHLRDGLLDLLATPNNAVALAEAVGRIDAEDLERQINARELCGTIVRSSAEWKAHPQGAFLAATPLIRITKTRPGSPVPFADGAHPLDGVRVLDMTHVLAGPMSTRTLAAHGADVLRISKPGSFELLPFAMDTGHGKRNAFVDLRTAPGCDQLRRLLETTDVYVDGYAPGKLASMGFGVGDVSKMKDGVICCSFTCYGAGGPCGQWGGFEQLGQAASGLIAGHSSVDAPQIVPSAACDYLTGGLATLGILAALVRRATEGGSYHVEVSLVRTGMWLHDLGDRSDAEIKGALPPSLDSFMMESASCFGTIRHLKPSVQYELTPPLFRHPVSPLGSARAVWA